jgi:hypothetical protein
MTLQELRLVVLQLREHALSGLEERRPSTELPNNPLGLLQGSNEPSHLITPVLVISMRESTFFCQYLQSIGVTLFLVLLVLDLRGLVLLLLEEEGKCVLIVCLLLSSSLDDFLGLAHSVQAMGLVLLQIRLEVALFIQEIAVHRLQELDDTVLSSLLL